MSFSAFGSEKEIWFGAIRTTGPSFSCALSTAMNLLRDNDWHMSHSGVKAAIDGDGN